MNWGQRCNLTLWRQHFLSEKIILELNIQEGENIFFFCTISVGTDE